MQKIYRILTKSGIHKYNITTEVVTKNQEIEVTKLSIFTAAKENAYQLENLKPIVSCVDNGNAVVLTEEVKGLEYYKLEALGLLLRFASMYNQEWIPNEEQECFVLSDDSLKFNI